ncbi:MAG: crossover junction endodeoxyribonuclease RuvC [Chloroflexi bacterium]|nr:crossover junction endodeoxyribonuclease RuvC [Chloroflexota bacterium]
MDNKFSPDEIIILGIDPGLTVTGWGIVRVQGQSLRVIGSGQIKTTSKESRSARLGKIASRIRLIIEEYSPNQVAIEQQFVAKNVRSAMAIGEARAAAMVAAAEFLLPVYEFAPKAIKEAVVGFGNATKEQVQQMVMMQLGFSEANQSFDVSDALAVALTRFADANLELAMARK